MIRHVADTHLRGEWDVLGILGHGGEGVVYKARRLSSGDVAAVKIFQEPRLEVTRKALQAYRDACRAGAAAPGLGRIVDLFEEEDRLLGLAYLAPGLQPIHPRLLRYSDTFNQAFFGAFCRLQHHLMVRCRITTFDTDVANFMLCPTGMPYFVDFGQGILPVDNDWALDNGATGYAFATLLLGLCSINIKPDVTPKPGYKYDRPCVYLMDRRLDDTSKKHEWVRRVLTIVREEKASLLLEPSLYRDLGDLFRWQPALGVVMSILNRALLSVGRARSIVRRRGQRQTGEEKVCFEQVTYNPHAWGCTFPAHRRL